MKTRLKEDENAVDSIIGDLLLVGITVIVSTALVFMIAQVPTPTDSVHAALTPSILPGADGNWNTGDETVSLRHGWGEPMLKGKTRIVLNVDGTETVWQGASLVGAFADGKLTVGETWVERTTIAITSDVQFSVVDTSAGSQLVVAAKLKPGNDSAVLCTSDNVAPTVNEWTSIPADVSSSTVGAVQIQAQVVDNCIGVDEGVTPHLFYSIAVGSPGAFTDAGPMTLIGTAKWQGTIPAQNWTLQVGKTIFYYVTPIQDLYSNSRTSQQQEDEIQPLTQKTYPGTHWDTQAAVTGWSAIQSAADAGAEAIFTEVGGPNYALSSQQNFTAVPGGASHLLELRYRTATEVFNVEVYDWVAATWNLKAPALNSAAATDWTIALASTEISGGTAAGGDVRVRFVDNDPLSSPAGTLYADYLRVSTS